MHDERKVEPAQRIEGALHTSRGEADGFARACQAIQRRALRRNVGKFAQLAQRHADPIVLTDHRQACRSTVHLLGLLDPGEAPDDVLSQLRLGFKIDHQRGFALLGDLLLPLQLPVDDPDPLLQRLAHLRVAFENELHALLGDHEQSGIRAGDHRGGLLLAHQAGLFTEGFTLAQSR